MTSILEKLHNWEKSVGADIKHIPAMLKEDVQEAIHHIDGSQSVIADLKAIIAQQQAAIDEKDEPISKLTDQISALVNENAKLKAELDQLKATSSQSTGSSFADIKTTATEQQALKVDSIRADAGEKS